MQSRVEQIRPDYISTEFNRENREDTEKSSIEQSRVEQSRVDLSRGHKAE